MRVVDQDFNNRSDPCPSNYIERFDTGLRTCIGDFGTGCLSTDYSTFGVSYSSVCGKLIGYHFGTPEAFVLAVFIPSTTIDDQYVDGYSLTHGSGPRQHIWSFAVGVTEDRQDHFGCPCNVGSTISVPSYIGNDYFCDSAASSIAPDVFYRNNPMWDGVGCAASNACCSFNSPPWFYKQLPESTSDDIGAEACLYR